MLCYAILPPSRSAMLCNCSSLYAMICTFSSLYAMLRYAMLRYAKLLYATLCYATLCYAMLCYAMLCYAMLNPKSLYFNLLNNLFMPLTVADKCHVGVQTFWASTLEDRAKVDLKFHFMKKTLNEVVSSCLVVTACQYCRRSTSPLTMCFSLTRGATFPPFVPPTKSQCHHL